MFRDTSYSFVSYCIAVINHLFYRRTKPLLTWLLLIVVCFFPECGLVLFMSLYYWTLHSSFGTAELIFWLFRVVMNIIGVLSVYSLYSEWKDDKNVNRRLRDINMTSSMTTGYYSSAGIKTDSLRTGYHNAAFLNCELNTRQIQQEQHAASNIATTPVTSASTINHHHVQIQRFSDFHRCNSLISRASLSVADLRDLGQSNYLNSLNGLNRRHQSIKKHQEEYRTLEGIAFGSVGIVGVGLDEYPNKSIFIIDAPDHYLNRSPLSRTVSKATLGFPGPSFDRQSQFLTKNSDQPQIRRTGSTMLMRRSHSLNDLQMRYPVIATDLRFHNAHKQQSFSYLPVVSNITVGNHYFGSYAPGTDDFHRISYKDVAL